MLDINEITNTGYYTAAYAEIVVFQDIAMTIKFKFIKKRRDKSHSQIAKTMIETISILLIICTG